MIVSVTITDNRENEIADAIRSVVDHVDCVLIVDTGITDRTIERAGEVAGKKLAVTKHTWVDFSTARNAGLDAAKSLGAKWIVIVDSDERLNLPDLHEALANTKATALYVETDDGFYPKEKILRVSAQQRYVGPTHETLIGGSRETLAGATFWELQKSPEQLTLKFSRDVRILSAYVKENPDDPRWWYYLGASYEGLKMQERAAEAFGECVTRRKIGNEAAWAAYKQAGQLFILKRFSEAVTAAARGVAANSTSAECAWVAATASWHAGQRDQAVAWARIAEAVGLYKGCGGARTHFRYLPALYELPYDVLKWALPTEEGRKQAEVDFRNAKRARVGAADDHELDRLSVSRNARTPNREEARSMLRPGKLSDVCPSAREVKIQFEPPGRRHPMNPSICQHNGELWCVVRAVNYTITGKRYTIHDADGVVRTENYLGRLEADGTFAEPRLMLDLDTRVRCPSLIVGYEDVRIVSLGSEIAASATVCDRNPNRRLIARLYLSHEGDVEHAIVQPSNQEHEKNWMPLAVGGKLTWIYSLDPTAVLPGPLRECPFALEHLRGGAVVSFEGGYLCVMHEVIDTDQGRIYLHRFVYLDEEFWVTAVSPAWVFAHHGIEFCCGVVINGDELILSYGIDDQEARIMKVDMKEVEAMEWMTP